MTQNEKATKAVGAKWISTQLRMAHNNEAKVFLKLHSNPITLRLDEIFCKLSFQFFKELQNEPHTSCENSTFMIYKAFDPIASAVLWAASAMATTFMRKAGKNHRKSFNKNVCVHWCIANSFAMLLFGLHPQYIPILGQ